MKKLLFTGMLGMALQLVAAPKITVDVNQPGHAVSPELFGVFFEDINLSADGGLYPELVRNRSFEDSEEPENWKFVNAPESKTEIRTDTSRPLNPLNRRSLRVNLEGAASLINEGYWGMNIVEGEHYTLKFAARAADGFEGAIKAKLMSGAKELGGGEVSGISSGWKYHTLEIIATGADSKAALRLDLSGKGTLFLDMVSLMPNKTWKNHGLRVDLAEAIDALKPAFLRFPGGCWVEGEDMAHMYDWKKTIGNVDVRTPLWNIWQYNATHGLGYHEYLQLCEDLGAEPLFCINVGMSHRENVPLDLMNQWVQDALDAIEYANGPTNSLWGGLRAKNGHPSSFNLKYLEIGNENGREPYRQRWPLFVKAIREKYPEIQLIANDWAGGYPKEPMPQIVDEHYYNTPEWFLRNAHKYDTYDRHGPKIFVGEYAVTRNTGNGNLRGALGEAAWMTGMERNSDVVIMASYAPLFCNANHKRWPVNLINFDSAQWFGLPSYYVQKMFAENRGNVTLPIKVEAPVAVEPPPSGCIGVGTWNTSAEFKDIRVIAPDGNILFKSDFSKGTDGWKKLGRGAHWSVQDGALRQTTEGEFIRALAGDRSWTDYTLELKARKISGKEGFLILFHNQQDDERGWWNLGGYNNTRHVVEGGEASDSQNGNIETGRWYDIKVAVAGTRVKCFLDGKLIHNVDVRREPMPTLFASATRDDRSQDVILKIVNSAANAVETEINLNDAAILSGTAKAVVLTSASAKDENTLEEPLKVSPREEDVRFNGSRFTRSFPGNSFTILRVHTSEQSAQR